MIPRAVLVLNKPRVASRRDCHPLFSVLSTAEPWQPADSVTNETHTVCHNSIPLQTFIIGENGNMTLFRGILLAIINCLYRLCNSYVLRTCVTVTCVSPSVFLLPLPAYTCGHDYSLHRVLTSVPKVPHKQYVDTAN
jgi:hypothetical protein